MFGKRKELKYHGCTHDKLEEVLYLLCDIEDTVGLSKEEEFAMHIAIHAVSSIMNAMVEKGRVKFDEG